jgi:hypothetical protein
VTYNATWPDTLPILKVGETFTFAGGEYKSDNPDPGSLACRNVGWAAGRVVFDSGTRRWTVNWRSTSTAHA